LVTTNPLTPRSICFGPFELDVVAGEVRKAGILIKLQPQPFRLLLLLAERAGTLVNREEIQQCLWSESTFVDFEHGINFSINQIRGALADDAEKPRYIETLPRRGYRFLASVSGIEGDTRGYRNGEVGSGMRRSRWTVALVSFAVIAAALFVLNVFRVRDRILGSTRIPPIQSLAVLPLTNLSGDPDQEYFSDGMTDTLITDLAQMGSVKVISRTSIMRYKKTDKSLPEIARELNVGGIIEGTVQRSGDRVRITAQLIEGATDKHLWAKSYERAVKDVLALQDEVARDVANEIKVKLTPQEQARLTRARPVNPEAHELYLRGRFHWNKRSPEGVRKSIEYFEQAIEKDPDNALAYSALADSYNVISSYNLLAPNEAFPKAKEAATKAVQLDDSLAEAHTSLAVVKAAYEWEWSGAEREYKRAIELNPGYATAHYWYAFSVLTRLGRFEEAIAEMNRALEFDPFSLIINTNLGWIFYYAHRYDDALEQCRKVLDLDSNFASAHLRMVQAYEQKGMFDDAIAETEKLIPLRREDQPEDIRALRKAYRTSGAKGYWRQRLGSVQQQMKHHYVSPAFVASIYASLGEKDEAFLWLEHAYAERDNWLSFLKVDPRFDTLRSDPRFQDLQRRIGLPQ